MNKEKLRVAMIGYQFMGRAHANAWRQVGHFATPSRQPELALLCGRTRPAVEAAATQLGFAEVSTDWEEIVRREDIDAIDICTPGDSHAEIAIAAAEAGKGVTLLVMQQDFSVDSLIQEILYEYSTRRRYVFTRITPTV